MIEHLIASIQTSDPPLQQGIANSLVSKLESAIAALGRGTMTAARNKLEAFIHDVEAQAGKSITDERAVALIAAASEILATIK